MTLRRVWLSNWQMQCCGESFEIGSEVTWTTWPLSDTSWFAEFLDPDIANGVTDHEDHHADDDAELQRVHGAVRAIDAVYCRYVVNDSEATPIEGSGELEPRSSADGWEDEDELGVGRTFVGYLVNVEVGQRAPFITADRARRVPMERIERSYDSASAVGPPGDGTERPYLKAKRVHIRRSARWTQR